MPNETTPRPVTFYVSAAADGENLATTSDLAGALVIAQHYANDCGEAMHVWTFATVGRPRVVTPRREPEPRPIPKPAAPVRVVGFAVTENGAGRTLWAAQADGTTYRCDPDAPAPTWRLAAGALPGAEVRP